MDTLQRQMVAPSHVDTFDMAAYPWPVFEPDEVEAVRAVLESGKVNYWTGSLGRLFESEFARGFGLRHAVAMANGTVTLQACLRALGVGEGDEVITTPRTFIGTSSAIVMEHAIPVLADVDRDSGNVTAETIETAVTPRTKAIIPVHLGGWPCDMEAIMDLAVRRGLYVIEDCAQSHGATIDGRHVGSFGHFGSWSFCQDKIMTTGGEGGMVGTNDAELWSRVWSIKDHGKSYDAVYNREHPNGYRWVHEGWGTNQRLTEMQSAIGLRQLQKLGEWCRARRRNAGILESRLSSHPAIRIPQVPSRMSHAYYKLYGYVRPVALKSDWDRDRILSELSSRGVPGLSGSCSEIYLERAFKDSGFGPHRRLPVAQELGEISVMFIVHPTLNEVAMHRMADVIEQVLSQAIR